MGGKLSEGINFSDDTCRLLLIAGVPFPTKTLEFDERCKKNKEYGSLSVMKTVNQAIGRAIRHKNDYAAVVLLDSRYKALKSKLSPWVLKNTKESSLIDGLVQINNFLKKPQ
jgi:chromosome transmission fidelity protein 1